MSITVVGSGNSPMVRIGALTRFEDYTGISTDGGRLYTVGANCMSVPRRDIMARMLDNSIYDFGLVDLQAAVGASLGDLRDEVAIQGIKPRNSDFNPQADHFHYGSLISSLISLANPSRPDAFKRQFARDHNVEHLNLKGRLIVTGGEKWHHARHSAIFQSDGRIYNGWNRTPGTVAGVDTYFTDKVSLSDLSFMPGTYDFGPISSFGAKMRAWTKDLISQNPSFTVSIADQYGLQTITAEVIDEYHNGDYFGLTYRLCQIDRDYSLNKWGSAEWLMYYCHALEPTLVTTVTSGGSYWLSRLNAARSVTYQFCGGRTWDGSTFHDFEVRSPITVKGPTVRPVVLSFNEPHDRPSPVEIHSDLLKDLRWFKGRVDVHFSRRNIQPASFYSSADALTDHIRILENNYIEVLSELPDMIGLIPDLKALLKALISISSSDLRTIVNLGDLLSSEILRYNFGIRPTVEVVRELNRHGPVILKAFDRFINPRTVKLRGDFSFDFPIGTFDTSAPTHMKVYSTLGIRYTNPAFSDWLGLSALGLSPGLSNIWEALPNSFIVDWAVNMSGRLAALDNQALFAMVAMDWCEHSYEITLPLSGTLLPSGYLSDEARLVYFTRHLSRCVPSVRESEFDFLKAGSFKSFVNALSLIWQKK